MAKEAISIQRFINELELEIVDSIMLKKITR